MTPHAKRLYPAYRETLFEKSPTLKSNWFIPARNTLLVVNTLFLIYLLFEFTRFWFRQFPQGFYDAG